MGKNILLLLALFLGITRSYADGGPPVRENWTVSVAHYYGIATPQEGGTCHMHAAVNLFEAECYRRTGIFAPVSRGIPIYEHLRNKFRGEDEYDPRFPPRSRFTDRDGGNAKDSLDLVLRSRLVTEDVVHTGGMMESLALYFRSIKKGLVEKAMKAASRMEGVSPVQAYEVFLERKKDVFPEEFEAFLRNGIEDAYSRLSKIEHGSWADQQQNRVDRCSALGMKTSREEPFSYALAISLLNKKKPFICAGPLVFPGSPQGKKPGGHVTNVVGYRPNKNFKSGYEFQVKDSNDIFPAGGWSLEGCKRIVYLWGG